MTLRSSHEQVADAFEEVIKRTQDAFDPGVLYWEKTEAKRPNCLLRNQKVGQSDGSAFLLNVMSWPSNGQEGRRSLRDNFHLILDKEQLATPPEVTNALEAFRTALIKIGGTPSSEKSKAQGARKKSLSRPVTIKIVDAHRHIDALVEALRSLKEDLDAVS